MQNFNQPQNIRSRTTGNLELRKMWHIPEAKFFWALFIEYEQETCELVEDGESKTPNWDNIIKTEKGWQNPQGYAGDEDWGKATAEHFGIEFPTEEYQEA